MVELLLKYQTHLDAKTDFSAAETIEVFNSLRTATDQESIGSFLQAWAEKGATAVEVRECARILRANCVKVRTKQKDFIDIVGTGGSRAKVFNVSTAAAFVVAGAGISVAKHGNRAASSRSGSADALTELGVNIVADTETAGKCLDEIGICFMFAPKFHNLTKELAQARKTLGRPTIFNLLGPLANPAAAPFQMIGVWNKENLEPMAEAVAGLGTIKTWIVHGSDGLDEITLNGKTFVAEIEGESIVYFEIAPEDFGFEQNDLTGFGEISPAKSAKIIREVLNGSTANRAAREIVLANAAAAIFICGLAGSLTEAVEQAEAGLESGEACGKLDALIAETNI
jgi:anthranilate phosphoribosyltransferase